jgi:hypothetical protein
MDFDRSKWTLVGPVGDSLDIRTQGHAGHRTSGDPHSLLPMLQLSGRHAQIVAE